MLSVVYIISVILYHVFFSLSFCSVLCAVCCVYSHLMSCATFMVHLPDLRTIPCACYSFPLFLYSAHTTAEILHVALFKCTRVHMQNTWPHQNIIITHSKIISYDKLIYCMTARRHSFRNMQTKWKELFDLFLFIVHAAKFSQIINKRQHIWTAQRERMTGKKNWQCPSIMHDSRGWCENEHNLDIVYRLPAIR